MDALFNQITSGFAKYPVVLIWAGNFLSALFLLIIGLMIGRWVRKRIRSSQFGGVHLDPTLKPVLASALFYIIIAMTLYAVLIRIGVPPTSLIAVFGAAGLAIGLALKDTLSNIAAGIMILVLRPLQVGEFVELSGCSGTIREIGLFATTIKTSEGIYQYIPNSKIWDNRITNYARHSIRRFTITIGISYDSDLRQAQSVMLDTLRAAPSLIMDAPEPEVHIMNFGPHSIEYTCRVWLSAESWGAATSELRIEIFEALGKANIDIPFPQSVVTMKSQG